MSRSIWGHDDDERWDQYERTWQGFLAVLGASLALSWLFSLSTQMEVEMLAPKIEGPVATVELVKTPTTAGVAQESRQPVDSTTLAAHREIRLAMAERVAERRDVEAVAQAQSSPVVATTSTTTTSTTTTTVDAWQPADECRRVPNASWLTDDVMQWCPSVAAHLDRYGWEPGDLTFALTVLACESGGRPFANQANWGTGPRAVWGLFSHRREFWPGRSQLALGRPGVIDSHHDDIHVAIWLWKEHQPWDRAWDGCAPKIRQQMNSLGIEWHGR